MEVKDTIPAPRPRLGTVSVEMYNRLVARVEALEAKQAVDHVEEIEKVVSAPKPVKSQAAALEGFE